MRRSPACRNGLWTLEWVLISTSLSSVSHTKSGRCRRGGRVVSCVHQQICPGRILWAVGVRVGPAKRASRRERLVWLTKQRGTPAEFV